MTRQASAAPNRAAGSERACALCGWVPPNGAAGLRELGAHPVAITVCRDRDECVRRFSEQ